MNKIRFKGCGQPFPCVALSAPRVRVNVGFGVVATDKIGTRPLQDRLGPRKTTSGLNTAFPHQ